MVLNKSISIKIRRQYDTNDNVSFTVVAIVLGLAWAKIEGGNELRL